MRQVVNANKPFGLGSLNVGYEGENNVTEVAFDFTEWVEQYGNGSPVLRVKRFRDTAAYPVVLDIESGNIAVWTITNTDLQYHGIGQGQLQYVVGDTVKKSVVFDFMVEKSLESSEDAPDPYDDWMDDLIRLTGESETNAYNASESASDALGYKNDAKGYSDTASGYAANASLYAGQAEGYKNDALGYKNDASASATQAQGYANNALGYKNDASGYASSAYSYASDASGYADSAQGYANDASGYADDASGYANDAQGYASDASDSADSALASAEEAREYAEQTERSIPSHVRQAIYTLLENAAYADTGLTDEIEAVRSWAEEVQSLVLSDTELELEEDTPQVITAVTIPYGATVSWTSSNPLVATVVDGIVTGVSNGSCTITATAGDKTATCDVTVSGFAELVSISAVYTQSGTVYDTDSLDSLKADLVVTATYSDSSTETVTAYTLSGTLTEGTSTITVTYGGKTTTFNVTITAEPSALYPMENGTHQFTNSSYSKVSISVTDNSSVHYQKTTGDTTGSYVIFDKVSANGESADTSNINAPTATLFTLQQGSSVEFTISNIVYSVVSGAAAQHKKYAIALRSGSTSIVTTGDLSPTDTSKTVTQTIAETKNITCLFVYAGGQITDLSFDVSLVVDGVRWI